MLVYALIFSPENYTRSFNVAICKRREWGQEMGGKPFLKTICSFLTRSFFLWCDTIYNVQIIFKWTTSGKIIGTMMLLPKLSKRYTSQVVIYLFWIKKLGRLITYSAIHDYEILEYQLYSFLYVSCFCFPSFGT